MGGGVLLTWPGTILGSLRKVLDGRGGWCIPLAPHPNEGGLGSPAGVHGRPPSGLSSRHYSGGRRSGLRGSIECLGGDVLSSLLIARYFSSLWKDTGATVAFEGVNSSRLSVLLSSLRNPCLSWNFVAHTALCSLSTPFLWNPSVGNFLHLHSKPILVRWVPPHCWFTCQPLLYFLVLLSLLCDNGPNRSIGEDAGTIIPQITESCPSTGPFPNN